MNPCMHAACKRAPGSRGNAPCKKTFTQTCKLVTWYPRKQVARNLWRGKHGKHGSINASKFGEKAFLPGNRKSNYMIYVFTLTTYLHWIV
jgi:hypothetical protein